MMDRYWFFTWRTYGTWLPGEAGFVGYHHNEAGERVTQNIPGTPTANPIPRLAEYSRGLFKSPPIQLLPEQAEMLLEQFLETARIREWQIEALAILINHTTKEIGWGERPQCLRGSVASKRNPMRQGNPVASAGLNQVELRFIDRVQGGNSRASD